jgi:predicted cation transporter
VDGESHDTEKAHRDLKELLEELRVALPGVEVLFAFLLTVPFSQRFTELSDQNRAVFFTAFVSAGTAIAFLIAPSAIHRIMRDSNNLRWVVQVASWCAIIGTVALLLAVGSTVYVVGNFVYDLRVAAAATAGIASLAMFLWFVLPLTRYVHAGQDQKDAATTSRDGSGRTRTLDEGSPRR